MDQNTITVLLIEDNPGDARLVQETLAEAGKSGARFEVKWGKTLAEGLQKLAEEKIDALLLDLNLPDSSGLDTFEKIKTLAISLPVILLTGLEDESIGDQVISAGAQSFLNKNQVDNIMLARSIGHAIKRKQLENKLRSSQQYLQAVLDASEDAIFVEDADSGQIIDVNRRMCEMYACTYEDALRTPISELSQGEPPYSQADVLEWMRKGREIGPQTFEWLAKRKDGSLFWVEVSIRFAVIGSANRFVVVARHIGERKQAEESIRAYSGHLEQMVEERTRELSEAQEQLIRQEKLATLGQLAGGVGHELRNPLGVISNAVYYLKLVQPDASDKVKQYHDILENEVRTAEKIITNLLDFSRVKYVDREAIAAPELAADILQRYPAPANINVTQDFDPALPRVYADPDQMIQVFGNLLVNAYQAMPDGGELTLRGEGKVHSKETGVAIHVSDTGMGISPENMEKIFDPLFTTKARGIGMGLAVCKKLVEANNGSMEVQSQPGRGSTFTIWLPVNEERAAK